MGSTPDSVFTDRLARTPFQPVFIMGDHRSGTTLLYQLLARTHLFNIVTAYHVIKYAGIVAVHESGREEDEKAVLARSFADQGLTDRKLDGVLVSPDLPEEYGFVLRPSGMRPQINSRTLPVFTELCRKVQLTGDPARLLLLKNPWDMLNFAYIKAALPTSRFIFLHRHPVAVVNSQLKATRSMFEGYNPYVAMIADWYGKLYGQPLRLALLRWLFASHLGLFTTVRHVTLVARYFLDHLSVLSDADHIAVTYESLCLTPDVTIGKILGFLGLPLDRKLSFADAVQPRNPPLLPEVQRARESIMRRTADYCRYCGYSAGDETSSLRR